MTLASPFMAPAPYAFARLLGCGNVKREVKATRCERAAIRRRSGSLGRECEALAGAFGGDQRFGMIFTSAALNAAAECGISLLEILSPLSDSLTDLLRPNHIAAANDHGANVCYCE